MHCISVRWGSVYISAQRAALLRRPGTRGHGGARRLKSLECQLSCELATTAGYQNVKVSSSAIMMTGAPPVEILAAWSSASFPPAEAAHALRASMEGK